MRSKQNQESSHAIPRKALAVVSAFAMAASGVGTSEAIASTRQPQKSTTSAEMTPGSNHPLDVLTTVITKLEKGKSVEVTTKPIELAGSIDGTVEGHPIVFKVGDQTYFAFRQGSKPNFNTSPEETASTMRIMDAQFPSDDTKISVTEAHLNEKRVLLENRDHTAVGYAIGENF